MRFRRASGLLLHPTSLPSPFGIGDLGPEAFRFADSLEGAGQRIWQVLPLGPTGYGDSPYQCFSAFAGNPLLISPERLLQEGFLDEADLDPLPDFSPDEVDYGRVITWKGGLAAKSYERFRERASAAVRAEFEDFRWKRAGWLSDFALFMALKARYRGVLWTEWEEGAALRDPRFLRQAAGELEEAIAVLEYSQFQFFRQWGALRRHCGERGVRIMGDVPIYVAHDSSDVWARPELFHLDSKGRPTVVAGVPPDYFSATGQLWGNPIYRWERLAADRYDWWIERLRATFELVDRVRLDHFRGFESYWEVPAGETTAVNGRWVKSPGGALFARLVEAFGELPLVAENLGVITPEVEEIRERFELPGMAVLQFAFGNDPQGPSFRPHNFVRPMTAYTGTHDNDTTVGWWEGAGVGDTTRSAAEVEEERAFVRSYLNTDGGEINWTFIRTLQASVADTVLAPVQDVLGEGGRARMNLPGRPSGNWRWRMRSGALTAEMQSRLLELARIYDRI